jgi:hypothetical protein
MRNDCELGRAETILFAARDALAAARATGDAEAEREAHIAVCRAALRADPRTAYGPPGQCWECPECGEVVGS